MGAHISDIVTATLQARQRNGVLRTCAKAPRDVQSATLTYCKQWSFP